MTEEPSPGNGTGTEDVTVYRQSPHLVPRSIGEELVLVPVWSDGRQLDRLYGLNEPGVYIWSQIDGRRTVGELARAVVTEFDVDLESARADLREFLAELVAFEAVQIVPP